MVTSWKRPVMKNLSLLILLFVSFILFLVGISIPGRNSALHIIVVVTAVALGFLFYVLTFHQVLTTPSLKGQRRIFWIVALVCLPMIGNLIYIIVHDALTRKQIPKTDV
jgi:NADH:ubiquinone oxidoreductase subunit 6 (subunit J)